MSSASKFSFSTFRSLGRRFAFLFTAGVLSDIGGFTTFTALILHVYNLTHKNTAFMGLTVLAHLVPFTLAAPLGGILAERFDRRKIMITLDLVRLPLVLLFMISNNVWAILGIQSLLSGATAAFNPSRQAIIPEVVPAEKIHLANSVNGGIISVVHVLGPPLGAVLYGLTQSMTWIVIINASTYAASAILLFMLPYARLQTGEKSSAPFFRAVWEGFDYVRGEKDLFTIQLTLILSNSTLGLMFPLLRPFIDQVLHGRDETYGMVIAVFGFGGLVGPLLGYVAGKRLGLGRTILTAFYIEAVLFIIWTRVPLIWLSCVVLFVWGINVFMMIPCYLSYVHTYAKPEFMGRTFALFDQSIFMPQIVGAGIVAALGNEIPTQNILTTAGVIYLVIVLLMSRRDGARLLRSRRGEQGSKNEPISERILLDGET